MRRVAAVAFVLTALVACGSKSKDASSSDSSTTAPATTAPATTTTTLGYVDSGDYTNGRHIGLIKSVNASDHSIDIDIVQFLTGDAAIAAYRQDTGDASGTPDNDYYVRNQNTLVRHLTLAGSASFRVQALGAGNVNATTPDQGTPVTFDTFASYWSGSKHGQAVVTLFWITLKDAKVTAVEEQFVP